MKIFIMIAWSVLNFNLLYVQQNGEFSLRSEGALIFINETIETEGEILIPRNGTYLKTVVDTNESLRVKIYEKYIANYDLINAYIYDDSESAQYHVQFKDKNVDLFVNYADEGEILSTYEKYKSVKIPYELSLLIRKIYPEWSIVSNILFISYSKKGAFEKIFSIKIENDDLMIMLRYNSKFEAI